MTMAQPIEVRDMRIVHITFRNAYDESARLVRASPTPSPGRVTFLADHIDFGVEMLHHHHDSEDLLLYPTLIERVPEQASVTEEVAHEHQLVADAIDAVSTACAAWRRQPSADRRPPTPELLWPQPWTASTRCSSPILTTRSRRSYRSPR